MSASTVVWIGPGATSFSCLCEQCLEDARTGGGLFSDALGSSIVRGSISPAALLLRLRCRQGHELVLRRVARPEALRHVDEEQLQLT